MTLADFLSPIDSSVFGGDSEYMQNQIGNIIQKYEQYFPDLEDEDNRPDLVLIGIEEERGTQSNTGAKNSPDAVRKHLYQLYSIDHKMKLADLGNVKSGHAITDTYAAVKSLVCELVKMNIVPILIGGSHDLTYAQYLGYQDLEQKVEVAIIDDKLDVDPTCSNENSLNSDTFLNSIMLHQPNYLFSISNIAYQSYLVSPDVINMYKKLFFSTARLGSFAGKLDQIEPLIRSADLISFDLSSIRASEAIGNANAKPNGLYGDEACQIAYYAGISDKCTSIGFYEYNPSLDLMGHTGMLLAQMIWCFMEGYYNRKCDLPIYPKSNYITYRLTLDNEAYELVFVKSKKSDRWWMRVPYPQSGGSENERFYLVPCRYEDYLLAVDGDMPDLWWRTHQKLE